MPVPKRKRSHARKSKRNANKNFPLKAFTKCPNCQDVMMPHQVCKKCGHYKGVKIMVTKTERAVTRGKARQAKEAQRSALQEQQETTASNKE